MDEPCNAIDGRSAGESSPVFPLAADDVFNCGMGCCE